MWAESVREGGALHSGRWCPIARRLSPVPPRRAWALWISDERASEKDWKMNLAMRVPRGHY